MKQKFPTPKETNASIFVKKRKTEMNATQEGKKDRKWKKKSERLDEDVLLYVRRMIYSS